MFNCYINELIFHNLHATLQLAVCIHSFYDVTLFWVLSYQSSNFKELSPIIFQYFQNIPTSC